MKATTPGKSIRSYLWKSIKPYRWQLFLVLQAPFIASCFVPITQYAIKIILDRFVEMEQFLFSDLTFPMILLFFGQFVAEAAWAISNGINYRSMVFIKANLTNRAYSYVLDRSYSYFQDAYSGSLSVKIENIQSISNRIFDSIKFNIINQVTALLSTVFLFFLVSKIFVFALLAFYIVFFPTVYALSKKLHLLGIEFTKKRQRTSGLIVDSISNIFSVLLFSNKSKEKASIRSGLDEVRFSEQKMLRYEFLIHLFIGGIYLSVSTGILFLLIYLRQQGKVTVGDFALILGATFHMLETAYSLVTNLTDLVKSWGELKESFSLFDPDIKTKNLLPFRDLKVSSSSILFQDVTFNYQNHSPILSHLTFRVSPGEKVGIVGHSGAGKSTLIHLLLRYFQPTMGKIWIDSQDINTVSETSLRKNISVVPQETILFHRSIKDNISYSKEGASDEEIIAATKKAHIYDFIQGLPEGLNTTVGERGLKLSGGQRQRIAIARAFLKEAPILILDEATSNLDSKSEKEIQQSLSALVKDKTVLAIAHRLSTLKQMDRIIFLENGTILEEGPHEALIQNSNGAYRRLWDLQKDMSTPFATQK